MSKSYREIVQALGELALPREPIKPCPKCESIKINFVMSSDKGNYLQCNECKWHPHGKKWITEREIEHRWNNLR